MRIIKLTKKDFNENNEYIGKEDFTSFELNQCSVEIEANLGWV